MSDFERVKRQQERQATRSSQYRREVVKNHGPSKVVASGRAKGYFWTKLVDRAGAMVKTRAAIPRA